MSQSATNDLSPIQRRREIAAILGRGLHRHLAACMPVLDDALIVLDVSAPSDRHVSWLAEPRA